MEAINDQLNSNHSIDSIAAYRLLQFGSFLRKRATANAPSSKRLDETSATDRLQPATVSYESLPPWLQYNDYLHHCHRAPTKSLSACVRSIFSIHSETVNIWSHLLGALIFLIILGYNFSLPRETLSVREKLAMVPFLVGFIICFTFSASFHILCCHSEQVYRTACACDYLGIGLALLGSWYSAMFYQWFCRWHIALGYCSFYTSIIFPFGWATLLRTLGRGDGQHIRAGVGLLQAVVSALSSLLHDTYLHGFQYLVDNYPLGQLLIILIIGITAAFLYSMQIPERLWPGKFDVWFHSHQLMHILVVGMALLGYRCLLTIADFCLRNTSELCEMHADLGA